MIVLKVSVITLSITWVSCTITGLNYMEPINFKPLEAVQPDQNPCNPLYWYPTQIPEFCFNKSNIKPEIKPKPIPMPVPVPLPPQPFPFPIPMPPMNPIPLPPLFQLPPYPVPVMPMSGSPLQIPLFPAPVPLPFGLPLQPINPMLPIAAAPGVSYPIHPYGVHQQAGMVPGLPGLVTDDGGINVLPFSDAYSNMLEKHKQKEIRKKLQKVLSEYYDDYPGKRIYKRIH